MTYDEIRKRYRPKQIKVLLIAESPPPAANIQSSRHFYRADIVRRDDRLFTNTIKALYPTADAKTESELEQEKDVWLKQFQADGYYMIEALQESQKHEVTKKERQTFIAENLPALLARVIELANKQTKIILIKSNVFDIAAKPLREAGFNVLNTSLVDYPGRYNQPAYREKLSKLLGI